MSIILAIKVSMPWLPTGGQKSYGCTSSPSNTLVQITRRFLDLTVSGHDSLASHFSLGCLKTPAAKETPEIFGDILTDLKRYLFLLR
jgi:hypothetical protein